MDIYVNDPESLISSRDMFLPRASPRSGVINLQVQFSKEGGDQIIAQVSENITRLIKGIMAR